MKLIDKEHLISNIAKIYEWAVDKAEKNESYCFGEVVDKMTRIIYEEPEADLWTHKPESGWTEDTLPTVREGEEYVKVLAHIDDYGVVIWNYYPSTTDRFELLCTKYMYI